MYKNLCALVGQIKNFVYLVLHKIPRIVTELFDQPAVTCKFDIQRYLVFIMLKCVFHPYSWHHSFPTDGQLRKRNCAVYCIFKQWRHTNFPNILGANSNFFTPEGRYEAPTNSSWPCCTKCIYPGDPLPWICTSLHLLIVGVPGSNIDSAVGCPHWGFFLRVYPSEPKSSITKLTPIASFVALSNSLFHDYFLIPCCTVYITGFVFKHTVNEYDR